MKRASQALHEAKISELAERYARDGYEVILDPGPELFPFDLGGYRPDLLARNGEEHVMAEVKATTAYAPIDRLVEFAQEVREHPGWHFLLVTYDEAYEGLIPVDGDLAPWEQLRERMGRAERLLGLKEPEGAFLLLWSVLEGVLRRKAEEAALPIERLGSTSVINHMYSYGEIWPQQLESAQAALRVRDHVLHGYQYAETGEAARELLGLIQDLLAEWAPSRRAA